MVEVPTVGDVAPWGVGAVVAGAPVPWAPAFVEKMAVAITTAANIALLDMWTSFDRVYETIAIDECSDGRSGFCVALKGKPPLV